MKKCPICLEEVHESAQKCRHCGVWFNREMYFRDSPEHFMQKNIATIKNGVIFFVVLAVIQLFATAILLLRALA